MATQPPSITEVSHLGGDTRTVYSRYSSNFSKIYDNRDAELEEVANDIARNYYDLVTDFFEYGYGLSFHFAPVFTDKTLAECISDFESEVGRDLHAKPGMKLLDLGCGVGGPARQIAKSSGAQILGLNISEYQVKRARIHTEKANLQHLCTFQTGNFGNMENFDDNTFDGAYAIESIIHSTVMSVTYGEIFRVLKPGACFVESAWAMTEKYLPDNPTHQKIRQDIIVGGGVPSIHTTEDILSKVKEAGFEILYSYDYRLKGDLSWCTFLNGKGCCSIQSFRVSTLGRTCTHVLLTGLELIGIVPKETTKVHTFLNTCADGLIESEKVDIFTPMLRIVARKPLS